MKIAEALALRSDLQKRLEQMKQRLVKNARIQEGDTPEEDPAELQSELEKSARLGKTVDPGRITVNELFDDLLSNVAHEPTRLKFEKEVATK